MKEMMITLPITTYCRALPAHSIPYLTMALQLVSVHTGKLLWKTWGTMESARTFDRRENQRRNRRFLPRSHPAHRLESQRESPLRFRPRSHLFPRRSHPVHRLGSRRESPLRSHLPCMHWMRPRASLWGHRGHPWVAVRFGTAHPHSTARLLRRMLR